MSRQTTRRDVVMNAAKAAVAAWGVAMATEKAKAQGITPALPMEKRDAIRAKAGEAPPAIPYPFTSVVGYGNLLYVSGVGAQIDGTIEEQTKWVFDQIEKNLIASGSSLDKVLKVDVYLEDIKMFDRMNAVYKTRNWGKVFPARNTTQAANLPGKDQGLAVDCVAYV